MRRRAAPGNNLEFHLGAGICEGALRHQMMELMMMGEGGEMIVAVKVEMMRI